MPLDECCVRTEGLGADSKDAPWLKNGECGEELRNERSEVIEAIRACNENDNCEPNRPDILLILKVLVRRNENLKPCGSRYSEEFSVFDTSPTFLTNGSYLMFGDL